MADLVRVYITGTQGLKMERRLAEAYVAAHPGSTIVERRGGTPVAGAAAGATAEEEGTDATGESSRPERRSRNAER